MLEQIWNLEGSTTNSDPHFFGYGLRAITPDNSGIKDGEILHWKAFPEPDGYRIEIETRRGPVSSLGATFNLALEVAAAIRRA